MVKFIAAEEAVKLIKDGQTIALSGFMGGLQPELMMKAIQKSFLETGSPKQLTAVHAAGQGDGKERGMNHLGEEGLLKRVVAGHYNLAPRLGALVMSDKVEAYCLPQGSICEWFRNIAGRRPGLITKVGLSTFVDPRVEGGKLSASATEDIVEVIQFNGEEWLWYKPFPIHVAIVRGTTADEDGNISMEHEFCNGENLSIAQAARACGGIVIAQVKRIAERGSIHSRRVVIPGAMVDYVVQAAPEDNMMTCDYIYDPSLSGEFKIPVDAIPPMKLNNRKIIARRAAMELLPNCVVNLGIGVPDGVSAVAAEEGIADQLTLTTEAGVFGGVPVAGLSFGASANAQAVLDQPYQFDFYDGGGLDISYLGLAEADMHGNVNVSKFHGRASGCGGFINITQNSKKVVYCGTFTVGGLKEEIKDGKLVIVQEGTNKKFLTDVEQITFSGDYAAKIEQPVLYVTERAVFKLTKEGVELIEIAPGVDLQKDVLDLMDFTPIMKDVKLMDSRIFKDELMGLTL